MLNSLLRVFLVMTVTVCISATAVLANGIPDPGMSTMDDALVTCPAGDVTFHVTVLDNTGTPCAGALVEIDFCDCFDNILCRFAGSPCGNGKNDLLFGTTNASGMAVFNPAGGGICGGSMVDIRANGVLLGQKFVAAMDYTGNFIVQSDDFIFDNIHNDYTGDGIANISDLTLFNLHAVDAHACDAPVDTEPQSWGVIKSLWR